MLYSSLIKISTQAETGRKILVIKDCFIPLMLNDFDVVDVLDLRYSRQRLSRLISTGNYTDILILYNAAGFAEDNTINRLLL